MVLTSNYARRCSNAENRRPSASYGLKKASSLKNSTTTASRRRRARTNGGSNHPRYVAEQAKRRSKTKSPAVRVEVTKRVEVKDAEMIDIPVAPVQTIPVTLPRYLARPDYRPIAKDVLEAIDSELAEVPLDYVHEGLEVTGYAMMQVLSSVEATPVKNALPRELNIVVNDLSSDLPTHMLAVYARQSPLSPHSSRQVSMFPTHSIVMASHCANLPMLPKSLPSTPDNLGQMTVPVVPLCIPSPETFSQLSAYLYTKGSASLLASLLPTGVSTPPALLTYDAELDSDSPELKQFSAMLRGTYTPYAILNYAMTVHALWRNVCALGIFDEQLWDILDLAWELLIGALGGKDNEPRPIPTSKAAIAQL